MTPPSCTFRPSLLLLIVAMAAPCLAQETARFVPANAVAFVEINDLAALRQDWERDPLAKYLKDNVPIPPQDGWIAAQKKLDLTGEQIIDRYFGTKAALVFLEHGQKDPSLVISKVSDDHAQYAIARLEWKPTGDVAGFKTYETPEGARVAAGGGWMIVASKPYAAAVGAVLEKKEKSLADDATFRSWMDKLPADRVASVFLREAADNVHVLGAVRKGRDVTLTYRGQSPDFKPILAQVGEGKALDFGPLPASTIAALTANFKLPAPPEDRKVNSLFAGKSFRTEILPKFDAPMVAFLSEVAGDALEPRRSFPLPVAGFSIKLKDHTAAAQLTNALNALVVVVNFSALKWEAPEVPVRDVVHRDTGFRVAEVGGLLSNRAQRDEFKPINIAYGRVGDWYVICTHEKVFTQCIDAHADPARSFVSSPAFSAMALQERGTPMLTAVLRPAELSTHIDAWLAHVRSARSQLDAESHKDDPATPEAKLVKGARIVAGLLGHYQSMSLQAYRDGDTIAAEAKIIRR